MSTYAQGYQAAMQELSDKLDRDGVNAMITYLREGTLDLVDVLHGRRRGDVLIRISDHTEWIVVRVLRSATNGDVAYLVLRNGRQIEMEPGEFMNN